MAEIMDVSDDSKKRKTTDEDKDSPDAVLDAFHRAASEADGDAYCAAMSTAGYNSFPTAPEVLRDASGGFHLVRKRSTLDQLLQNEVPVDVSL